MKVLIIDEISMVDGAFLDRLEYAVRMIRQLQKPWGGVKVIGVGDFLQLPPIGEEVPAAAAAAVE